MVQLDDGTHKSMDTLATGDRVLVGAGQFSDVFMFSHRADDVEATFVRLTTASNRTLTLTPDHYLYVNGALAAAKTVSVGDALEADDGSSTHVTATSVVRGTGLYNPHTLHGDIVVDGIKTSTYTTAVAPGLAHMVLAPLRMLYALGISLTDHVFDHGSDLISAIAPPGLPKY